MVALIIGLVVGWGLMGIHRLLGSLIGAGLSTWLAPWLVPALVTGGITLVLLTLLSAARPGVGSRRASRGDDWTWYSSRGGGWSGGSFDSGFSGGGGDFGGGGASGDW